MNRLRFESRFPVQRPDISITPSQEPAFEVDWRELAWSFVVPEAGNRTLWAVYDPPDWRLTSYTDSQVTHPAVVHGIDGVEISSVDREADGQQLPWTLFARLIETRVEYLATISLRNGTRRLYTLLDEGFDDDWGDSQRLVRPTGRFVEQPDGSYHQIVERLIPGEQVEGMGVCGVRVGDRSFTCLRVLDVPGEFSEESLLMEGYLTREGRTVLCRRYNGRLWQGGAGGKTPWDEEFPDNNRIVIDGVTFVHWYDCLCDRACGIDP